MADSAEQTLLPGELKPGPKPVVIDREQLQNLARLGLPKTVIADYFGVSRSTLQRKLAEDEFAGAYQQGVAQLKAQIATKLSAVGLIEGNPSVLLRMAEKWLDYGRDAQVTGGTMEAEFEDSAGQTVTMRWTPQMDADFDSLKDHVLEHDIIDVTPVEPAHDGDEQG